MVNKITCQHEEDFSISECDIDKALLEAEAIVLSGAEMLDFYSVAAECREELLSKIAARKSQA